MKILVLAATSMEIQPFLNWRESLDHKDSFSFLISGPGTFFTTLSLMENLSKNQYDFMVQAGIAGAYSEQIEIGSVYQVETEQFGDWGAMDKENFLDFFTLGLWNPNTFPFSNGILINPYMIPGLPKAKGLTLNCASGNREGIDRIKKLYNPDLESLEGAPFAYIALSRQISFIQLRSVSNRVEPRNRDHWNIPLAIQTLNQNLIEVLQYLIK